MDIPSAAQRQGGLFTAAQALNEGWSARQVRRRVSAGQWVYVAGRGLAVPAAFWTPFQLAMAIHLTWPDAVTSHRTAGALHGFPVEAATGGMPEATTARIRSSRGVRLHALRLAADEVERLPPGLVLTTARRTAVDCLAVFRFHEALDLWSWVSTRGVLDLAGLGRAIEGRRCWDGTVQLRRLADTVRDGAVSGAEFHAHRLLREAGIEGWNAGVPVQDAKGVIGVADILFEGKRVVVEIDGFRTHRTRAAFVADARRQNRLTNAGYHVLRFTWDDLIQRPQGVIREIREALDSHADSVGLPPRIGDQTRLGPGRAACGGVGEAQRCAR